MNFNINNYVRVKLTNEGRKALLRRHDEYVQQLESIGITTLPEFNPPKEDGNGWSQWQLWDLMMRLGGNTIDFGKTPPFETTIIIEEPVAVS